MTNKQRAREWMTSNLVKASGRRAETLEEEFEQAQKEVLKQVATWLGGLEYVLQREIQRTGDPQLIARRGIYEGIAAEVLGGNWKRP